MHHMITGVYKKRRVLSQYINHHSSKHQQSQEAQGYHFSNLPASLQFSKEDEVSTIVCSFGNPSKYTPSLWLQLMLRRRVANFWREFNIGGNRQCPQIRNNVGKDSLQSKCSTRLWHARRAKNHLSIGLQSHAETQASVQSLLLEFT